jgi:hypothetical protein
MLDSIPRSFPASAARESSQWSKKEQVHPYGVRQPGHIFNAAAIFPKPFCELEAKCMWMSNSSWTVSDGREAALGLERQ